MHPVAKGGVHLSVHGVRLRVLWGSTPHTELQIQKFYNYVNIIRTMRYYAYGVGGA